MRSWDIQRVWSLVCPFVFVAPTLFVLGCGCSAGNQGGGGSQAATELWTAGESEEESTSSPVAEDQPGTPADPEHQPPAASGPIKGGRSPEKGSTKSRRSRPDLIQPGNIVYMGAFRLPEGSNDSNWEWSGDALTYNPEGDPQGGGDGYPGSLFGIGHDWQHAVSEISIPQPVIADGNLGRLKRAKTLQPFTDIKHGRFPDLELPVAGLEYLTGPQGQTPGVLHFAWGQHMQEGSTEATHGWVSINLSDDRIVGPWRIGSYQNYSTNDYIFEIPGDWANKNLNGKRLATGRFREGGQGGRGPSLIAYDPYNGGTMARRGDRLPVKALILYTTAYDGGSAGTIDGYQDCDEWTAGAWLTAGTRSAVIFLGNQTVGECWYGFSDGTRHPNPQGREGPGDRGFWATRYAATIIFYDSNDLAAVARGTRGPTTPQPYASLVIDQFLNNTGDPQMRHHVRGMAFNRRDGTLYVLEFLGDGDRSLIHVFRIRDLLDPTR